MKVKPSSLSKIDLSSQELSRLERLKNAIDHAVHLLPAQGPITVFIHHNTLHAFEDLPFDEAVKRGAAIFGCRPYLTEEVYHEKLRQGRIRTEDIQWVLQQNLGEAGAFPVLRKLTRFDLRMAMMHYRIQTGTTEELLWHIAETDALHRVRHDASDNVRRRLIAETRRWVMRDLRGGNEASRNGDKQSRVRIPECLDGLFDRFSESTIENWNEETWESFALNALWRVCRDGVRRVPPPPIVQESQVRHRDLLVAAGADDPDLLVNDVLIRFTAAFLDQGFARESLPLAGKGCFRAFLELYRKSTPDRKMRPLAREAARLLENRTSPVDAILQSLLDLGIPESEWEEFLNATLLALRGWGGMVHQVEVRRDSVARPIPQGSTVEYVAVRLLADRWACRLVADKAGFTTPLDRLREELKVKIGSTHSVGLEQRAFLVFQLAQLFGWSPEELHRLAQNEWTLLLSEIEAFSGLERRQTFHAAFERRFRAQTLDAIGLHSVSNRSYEPIVPRFQAIFCIDDREESIRRHLEELAPDAQTFGAAGFFNVPMYYRGITDAHFVPLCPIVIEPEHWVAEEVAADRAESHQRRRRTRKVFGALSHMFHLGTRSFALGALLSGGLGGLASIPLIARILVPRWTARILDAFGRFVTPDATQLTLERKQAKSGPENGGLGFSIGEMTDMSERLLRDIGLTSGFAGFVAVVGHGSSSMNNPHRSAYDCGACGGGSGGPNARAIARMLNDSRVRKSLGERGIDIPERTIFVGAFHNTCDDSITFADLDAIPEIQRDDFQKVQDILVVSGARNAHERCRRFMSAPLTLSFEDARKHVESRSEDLAQTRPECGHATNAIAFVGRRSRTRGLFLDRRAFLVSYDPTRDDDESRILTRILTAVFPVCAGINLEYYFSYVDSIGWGCGTKLPHNIVSLLGVMDGASSDLRTGLPWQMVEIHEPVRILFVIETTPEVMIRIMDENESIGRLCRNGWVQLAVLDPNSSSIETLRPAGFRDFEPTTSRLPTTDSSIDWYRGWREHLEFAEIDPSASVIADYVKACRSR